MLTWRLWQALCHPPYRHPLFARTASASFGSTPLLRALRFAAFYVTACTLFTLSWPIILSSPALVLLSAAASANTLYSLTWAARIGSAIAREHEQKSYDLLCLLPVGALGAGWALSTAHLHRSALFRTLRLLMHSLALALLGALLTIIPVMLTLASGSPASYGLFLLLDYGAALAAAFYFDHVQSVTLAYLIGMITASIARNRINAQLWSAGFFLLLQGLVYLLILILGIVLLPAALHRLHLSQVAINVVLPIICLAAFYAVREAIIRLLWRLLAHEFNASDADQDSIFDWRGG